MLKTPIPQLELALMGEDETYRRRFRDLAALLGVKVEEPPAKQDAATVARGLAAVLRSRKG